MDRTQLISSQPRHLKILRNGTDISAQLGVDTVKYNADGTTWGKFKDGRIENGTWHFLNKEQTQIEVTLPRGTTRWLIIELHDDVFRKANLDSGAEFIYSPVR